MAINVTEETRKAAAAANLRLIDPAELLSAPKVPREWLIDEMLPVREFVMIHGAGGTGKSLLALAISVAVASGTDFLGNRVTQGHVLYFDAENGESVIRERLDLLGAPKDIDLLPVGSEGADLTRSSKHLETIIRQQRPSLIVCDSFASLWSVDENSASEVTWALRPLSAAAREVNATILLLHHDLKDGTNFRGTTALSNVPSVRIHLQVPNLDDPGAKQLTLWKSRLRDPGAKRWIRLRCDDAKLDVEEIDKPLTAPAKELRQQMLDLLKDGEYRTNASIAEALGRSRSDGSVSRMLSKLIEEGLIERDSRKGNRLTKPEN